MSRQKRKGQQPKIQWPLFKTRLREWYASKGPILWFGFKFMSLSLVFFTVSLLPSLEKAMASFVNHNARLASAILNLVGEHSHVTDGTIYSPQYAITVLPACTALEFGCFYCAIVLALPAPWVRKILGIIIGFPLLTALNLLRIISLYFVGVHFGSSFFNAMHEQIWGIILIPATLYLCLAWARWARKNEHLEPHPAT